MRIIFVFPFCLIRRQKLTPCTRGQSWALLPRALLLMLGQSGDKSLKIFPSDFQIHIQGAWNYSSLISLPFFWGMYVCIARVSQFIRNTALDIGISTRLFLLFSFFFRVLASVPVLFAAQQWADSVNLVMLDKRPRSWIQ